MIEKTDKIDRDDFIYMAKLIIEGNRVYSIDEACMRKKNLTLEQIRQMEAEHHYRPPEEKNDQTNDPSFYD